MKFGIDMLGAARYQPQALAAQRPGDCAGIFLRTFMDNVHGRTDSKKVVAAWCESGKFSEIVIHLAPFAKDHNYSIKQLKKRLITDTRWAKSLQKRYPKTQLMLSPFCEHKLSAKEMTPLFQELHSIAPNCLFVNSILDGGEEVFLPYVWTEIHIENTTPRKQPKHQHTISFDGFGGDCLVDFFTANIRGIVASFPNARHMRGWNFRCNCKRDCRDTTPIPDRTAYPDVAYLKKIRSKF